MSARGVDFLEYWISQHVTAAQNDGDPQRALVMATRCIFDADGKGISREEMESEMGSVEDVIRNAIEHLAAPGTPGD